MPFRDFYHFWVALALTITGCYGGGTPLRTSTKEVSSPQWAITEVERRSGEHRATDRTDTVITLEEAVSFPPQSTILVAEDLNTQINIRTSPSIDSAVIGTGFVHDEVTVSRFSKAEDGYTWYYVQLSTETYSGWVREDFVNSEHLTATPVLAADGVTTDMLIPSLDDHCNGIKGVEAYYRTTSFIAYICKPNDRLIYISNQVGTTQVLVTEEVKSLPDDHLTYVAHDDGYEYHISGTELVVYRANDRGELVKILQESVSMAERY